MNKETNYSEIPSFQFGDIFTAVARTSIKNGLNQRTKPMKDNNNSSFTFATDFGNTNTQNPWHII